MKAVVVADSAVVAVSCAIAVVAARQFGWYLDQPFVGRGAIFVTTLVVLTWFAALAVNSAWDRRLLASGTEYYVRIFRSTFYAFGLIGLVGFAGDVSATRPFVLFALPIGLVTLTVGRWFLRLWFRRRAKSRRVGVLANEPERVFDQLCGDQSIKLELAGSISYRDPTQIAEEVSRTSIEILAIGANHGLEYDKLREVIWIMDDYGIELWFESSIPLIRAGRSITIPTSTATVFVVSPLHLSPVEKTLKRALDIVFGLAAIIILSPVVVAALCVVYVADGRPLIFKQVRVGQYGNPFTLRKIRTMQEESRTKIEDSSSKGRKDPFDPRITRVGRMLRRWSIDEIPQLINVLGGSMSLVGPRPRLGHEISTSSRSDRRLRAKPGLTGPWQTSGRADIPLDEAESIDLAYVDGWTLLGDVVLIIRTIKVVLSRRGAY